MQLDEQDIRRMVEDAARTVLREIRPLGDEMLDDEPGRLAAIRELGAQVARRREDERHLDEDDDRPPWGPMWSFGITVVGAVVTVHSGTIEVGDTAYTTLETDVTITGDGQFIGLAVDRSAGTAVIGLYASRPESEDQVYRTALYTFDLDGGQAILTQDCRTDIRLAAIV